MLWGRFIGNMGGSKEKNRGKRKEVEFMDILFFQFNFFELFLNKGQFYFTVHFSVELWGFGRF